MLGVGIGALSASAYTSGNFWLAFWVTFVPLALLWLLLCYASYRGLTSRHRALRAVFWLFVVFHVFVLPVGTAIAGACFWLWRSNRKINDSATTTVTGT